MILKSNLFKSKNVFEIYIAHNLTVDISVTLVLLVEGFINRLIYLYLRN